jgi:hypothetical protein
VTTALLFLSGITFNFPLPWFWSTAKPALLMAFLINCLPTALILVLNLLVAQWAADVLFIPFRHNLSPHNWSCLDSQILLSRLGFRCAGSIAGLITLQVIALFTSLLITA